MPKSEFFAKAQPTAGDVHIDRPLTDVSVAYQQDDRAFIAGRVFPTVGVGHKSNTYRTYPRGSWFRSTMAKRAPGAESAGTGWTMSTDSYLCDRWALHKDIDDETRGNADPDVNLDRDATLFLSQQLLLLKEIEWITAFFTSGVWTDETSPTTWTTAGGGDPIGDIRATIMRRHQSTGYRPNTLVMGPTVWNVLQDHPDIIARISTAVTGIATLALIAQLFEVDNVYVAHGVQNTAVEGATDAFSWICPDHMLVCYSNPNPGLLVPSAGYSFAWTGFMGAGSTGGRVKRFRLERNESDRIESELAFDMKQIADDMGALMLTCTT